MPNVWKSRMNLALPDWKKINQEPNARVWHFARINLAASVAFCDENEKVGPLRTLEIFLP